MGFSIEDLGLRAQDLQSVGLGVRCQGFVLGSVRRGPFQGSMVIGRFGHYDLVADGALPVTSVRGLSSDV